MRANRHAFTLIELLVVITIIMVLVALIYPAASGVFRMAQETQCQNHLNELGKITVAYCQMHDGRFPPPCDTAAMGPPPKYSSGWLFGGTSPNWVVNAGIYYKEKLIGDPTIFWCPIEFDQYGLYQRFADQLYWRAPDTTSSNAHVHPGHLWSSYAMNGWVYYNPSSPSSTTNRTESRLSSEFTANHFLFVEEHDKKGRFNDGMMDGMNAKDKLADRHEGYGFIACMDGHVIKMTEDKFDATKTSDQKKYWTPR